MPETKPMTASAYVDLQVAEDAPADHPPPELFLTWATPVAQHHERPIEVSIRLVSRAESAALNHQYRGKSTPTNVLSFPFEAPPGIDWNEPFVGDLAVCVDLMASEAAEQQKPPHDHWAHITIHGILHLLGYDHIDDSDATIMEALECHLLAQLGIPDPYRTVLQENQTTHE